MPNNSNIEQAGIDAVCKYERSNGRTEIKRVHKVGYDLVSKSDTEERHIEVKSTRKTRFTSRWLEQMEYNALMGDESFYLYLVTQAGSATPKIWPYDKTQTIARFTKEIRHFDFKFSKEEFNHRQKERDNK